MTTTKQFSAAFGPMVGVPVVPCPTHGVIVVTLQYPVGAAAHDVEVDLEAGYAAKQAPVDDRTVFTVTDDYVGSVQIVSPSGLWAPRGGYDYMCACEPRHHTHVVVPLALPKLSFVRVSDRAEVTALTLEQGDRCRVEIRCTHKLDARFTVQLVYPGAEAKQRPATRSVVGTDYLYLSRIRLAEAEDGIVGPIHDMCTGAPLALPCAAGRWDTTPASPFLRVKAMTIVGLEWGNGDEVLEARLVDRQGTVHDTARLTVKIDRPAQQRGSYRMLDNASAADFKRADEDFAAILAKASAPADSVKLGICDTGIFDDSASANYLAPRVVGGRFFSTDALQERPTAAHDQHPAILDGSPSKHGTNVAAQAAWGSTKLQLVDVMVQKGQTMGDMNGALTKRAFEWAGAQGVSVVNCSKVMSFNTDQASEALTAYPEVLFLATGGNTSACFPFHYGELAGNEAVRNAFKGDCGIEGLPRNFTNTLLVGGHDKGPKHHASRGYGPGIDVMVYSDEMTLYTPRALIEAFRLPSIDKLRRETLAALLAKKTALDAEPATVSGELPMTKRHIFNSLVAREAALSLKEQAQLAELRLMQQQRPNPKYVERQMYIDTKALLEAWPWPGGSLAAGRDAVVSWLESFIKIGTILKRTPVPEDGITAAWSAEPWGRVKGAEAAHRFTVCEWFYQTVKTQNLELILRELRRAEDGTGVAVDNGVSFGLPIVANVAAKLKLLRRTLVANQLRRILIDTSDYTKGFESECLAKGVVNPLRAYFAAYDDRVVAGGTDPRTQPPAVDDTIEPERRIYYNFYYMNPEGKQTYDAIKGQLKAIYKTMDVDLIEAEPPIQIMEEEVTYVTDKKIAEWSWQNVVDLKHPLTHAPKHLRLVLAAQCGHVEPAKEVHSCEWTDPTWTPKNEVEHRYFVATVPKYSYVTAIACDLTSWRCTVEIRDPGTRRIFPSRLAHVVDRVRVGTSVDNAVIGPEHYTVERVSPTAVRVTVTDQTTVADIRTGKHVYVEVRVVQQIGGNRDKNNIFITNRYHAGPNGSPQANASVLVLFLHEIGHALGLVPTTHAHHYDHVLGGEGHHCGMNTQTVAKADALRLYQIPADGDVLVKVPVAVVTPGRIGDVPPCVMYHTRSSAHHASKFCATCISTVKDELDAATWTW